MGETPNIAARLESLAAPGTVIVSSDTHALVEHRVDAAPLGPQQLKGISRPIEVYRIDGLVDVPTRFALGRTRSEIVGRARERSRLLATIEHARTRGEGALVGICGEPGVGKSRLLESVLEALGPEVTVVRAQCNPHLASTAFHPIIDAVRRVGGAGAHGPTHQELAAPLDTIDIDDVDVRASLIHGISERLLAAGDGTSVVLAFEDVHWADPSTLDVLGHLAGTIGSRPAVVIVTHRPDQVPDWLAELVTVDLAPLDREGFDALVAKLAAERPLSSEVRDRLYDRTGGVPLFVEELVSALLESGDRADSAAVAEIPTSLNDVLVTRLDRCGAAKRTAQIASVIGRSVPVRLLDRMAQSPDVASHLEVLVRAGVLERSGSDEVRFRHALVLDAAYSTMLRSSARMLHERAAASLLALDPEVTTEAPEILARHLHHAGRFAEALELFRAAAAQSIERSAPHETVAHLTGALDCLAAMVDERDPRLELDLLLQLGPALIAARGYGSEDVQHTYERAAKLCEQSPESVEAFGALLGLTAFFLVSEQLDQAHALSVSMTEHAAHSGQADDAAEAAAWLGTTLFFEGRFAEALPLLAHASDHTPQRTNERDGRAGVDARILALSHLVWMQLVQGDLVEAGRRRDQMMDLADRLDRAVSRAHAINYAAGYALVLGDDTEALRLAQLEREVAAAARLPHYVAYAQVLAGAALRHRRPVEGADQLRAGIRMRADAGARLAVPFHYALLAETELVAGRTDRARAAIDEARRLAHDAGELWWLPEIDRLDGLVLVAEGDPVGARRCLSDAVAGAESIGAAFLVERTRHCLADLEHTITGGSPCTDA